VQREKWLDFVASTLLLFEKQGVQQIPLHHALCWILILFVPSHFSFPLPNEQWRNLPVAAMAAAGEGGGALEGPKKIGRDREIC